MIRSRNTRIRPFAALSTLALLGALPAGALEIEVLSNRADLISGGDALVEIAPAPASGSVIDLDGNVITGEFALRPNGRYQALLTGMSVGTHVLRVTQPDSTGARITIENHPSEGPVFTGDHLQPWDCTTADAGLGEPDDANCNVEPRVEWLYKATPGGSYQAYDLGNPPTTVATVTTDQGKTVRNIIRRESGSVNRGLYAFAVLHDPAISLDVEPWDPQVWNGKLHYPFGASCNTNQTQGSDKTGVVTQAVVLERGWAVATTSLNELGHHCNPIVSAETAMMAKEIVIEALGQPRFTTGQGASGGSIGQLVVSNAYPGLVNGLLPSLTYPGIWSNAMEVGDCLLTEAYWAKNPSFTPIQRMAVDGHGSTGTTCAAWVALFVPSGIPTTGCFSGSTLPGTSTRDPARDYDPVTNPDGCRATVHDLQVNVIGRRLQDGFAKFPIDNTGVQYGLEALNRPVGDPGKITLAQFLDLNARIGATDIDGTPTLERWRMPKDTSRNVHRSSLMNDTSQLDKVAIIDMPSRINEEIHTPYHADSIEARMLAEHGHAENHVIWSGLSELLVSEPVHPLPFDTMNEWLEAIEADGGIDPLFGMDPAKIVANKPAIAVDSCFIGGSGAGNQETDPATCAAAWPVFADARIAAGMPIDHDILQCQKKPVDAADYASASPLGGPLTAPELDLIRAVFPEGVCDWTKPSIGDEPALPWATYRNGPGGEPLGPPPVSTTF
jgi:hypothetical protein